MLEDSHLLLVGATTKADPAVTARAKESRRNFISFVELVYSSTVSFIKYSVVVFVTTNRVDIYSLKFDLNFLFQNKSITVCTEARSFFVTLDEVRFA